LYANYRSLVPGEAYNQNEFTEKMQPFLRPYTREEQIDDAEADYEAGEERKAAWLDFAAVARVAGIPPTAAWVTWLRGMEENDDPWWYQNEEAESAKVEFTAEWMEKNPDRSEEEAEDAWLQGYSASADDPWWWIEE
jgi:hypothetical protein